MVGSGRAVAVCWRRRMSGGLLWSAPGPPVGCGGGGGRPVPGAGLVPVCRRAGVDRGVAGRRAGALGGAVGCRAAAGRGWPAGRASLPVGVAPAACRAVLVRGGETRIGLWAGRGAPAGGPADPGGAGGGAGRGGAVSGTWPGGAGAGGVRAAGDRQEHGVGGGAGLARSRGFAVWSARPSEAEAQLSFAGLADLLEGGGPEVLAGLPVPQRRAWRWQCAAPSRTGGTGAASGRGGPVGRVSGGGGGRGRGAGRCGATRRTSR